MMSAGSHSIADDEGEKRRGRTDGESLNRELVSRRILIMSQERRRREERTDNGERDRIRNSNLEHVLAS